MKTSHFPAAVNEIIAGFTGNGETEIRSVQVKLDGCLREPTKVFTGHHAVYKKQQVCMDMSMGLFLQLFYLPHNYSTEFISSRELRLPNGADIGGHSTLESVLRQQRRGGQCFGSKQPLTLILFPKGVQVMEQGILCGFLQKPLGCLA